MWNPLSFFKSSTDKLLSASDKQQLVQAIQAAEKTTSGEIRVFVESKTKNGDALATAIYADQGIYDKVGVEFWYSQVQEMTAHFKTANYVQGMVQVIGALGKALTDHFPFDRVSDTNELSDEIMTGK